MTKASLRLLRVRHQQTAKWLHCWRSMGEMMDELERAPLVGVEEFRRIAGIQGNVEAESVPMNPLPLDNGTMLLRSRPGRIFVRDKPGAIVAVLSRCLA